MVEWEYPTNPREASGLDPEAVHRFSDGLDGIEKDVLKPQNHRRRKIGATLPRDRVLGREDRLFVVHWTELRDHIGQSA